MDANFSCLTHLKATLGGRTGGQSAARHSGGGVGGWGIWGFVVLWSNRIRRTGSHVQFPIRSRKKSRVEKKNEPKTKRTITFVGLLKASCHGRQELVGGDPFKGGASASVLLVRMLSVRRLGTSGGGKGLPWSRPLGTVPVALVWRGHTNMSNHV